LPSRSTSSGARSAVDSPGHVHPAFHNQCLALEVWRKWNIVSTRARSVKVVVVGGGSWGTAFSRLLADGGHEVTLACRDPEQAAAIAETGRNPRYLTGVDLRGIAAAHEV